MRLGTTRMTQHRRIASYVLGAFFVFVSQNGLAQEKPTWQATNPPAKSVSVDSKQSSQKVIKTEKVSPRLSRPLIQVARPFPKLTPARRSKLKQAGEPIPGIDRVTEIPNPNFPLAENYYLRTSDDSDPVLQKQSSSTSSIQQTPQILAGFDGMGNVSGAVPPDTVIDVGPSHIVQMVNTAIAIWDKQGNQLLPPVAISSLWQGFGGICENTNLGDPIVVYDSAADRWLVSQFAFNSSFTDNHNCIAISQTGDPTGAWYLYDFFFSDTKFNDYPKYGVWHNGYYAGVNQFSNQEYAGAAVIAFEREQMLAGLPARQVIIDLETVTPDAFTPMPADIDGINLPPAAMPAVFLSAGGPGGTLDTWQFQLDWSDPGSASVVHLGTLETAPYDGAVCNFARSCVEQRDTTQNLDSIPQRLMFRAAYRSIDQNQGRLVVNHTVVGSDQFIPGVRWYELAVNQQTSDISILNQGTYSPDDGLSRWMASAATDAAGNLAITYSTSGAQEYPSIRMTGRSAADPSNLLTVAEQVLKQGEASQAGSTRWGDYSALVIDPADDCTFWYSNQYYQPENTRTTSWSTYIGSFKFPNCVSGPSGLVVGQITDSETGAPIPNVLIAVGATAIRSDENGDYQFVRPADLADDFTFTRYGWITEQRNSVTVGEDQQQRLDVALTPASPVVVTGQVSDGSARGGPLYAKLQVEAPGALPGESIESFTDPFTGTYRLDLFAGALVRVNVASVMPGYLPTTTQLSPQGSNQQDFQLLIDSTCTAQGYGFEFPAFNQAFENGVPPAGWSTQDNSGNGTVWGRASEGIGNILGTTGDAALIDSDAAGEILVSSTLTSPQLNVADLESLVLSFKLLFRSANGGDRFALEISLDNGPWNNLAPFIASNQVETFSLDLSDTLQGVESFRLRWNYSDAFFEWYALIDDVRFGEALCVLQSGNLVQGVVADANTQRPINQARVVVDNQGTPLETTTRSTGDSAIGDGYFSIFVPADAEQSLQVSAERYGSVSVDINQPLLEQPILLPAGRLIIDSNDADLQLRRGQQTQVTLPIVNEGGVDVTYEAVITQAFELPNGPFHPSTRLASPDHVNDLIANKLRYKQGFPLGKTTIAQARFVDAFLSNIGAVGVGYDSERSEFWLGNATEAGGDDQNLYAFDSEGRPLASRTISTDSYTGEFAAEENFTTGVAFNPRTRTLWQAVRGQLPSEFENQICLFESSPETLQTTGRSLCIDVAFEPRGVAYDPISNTYYVGSFADGLIHQIDPLGNIVRSVQSGLAISGLALNPVNGRLYVHLNDESPAPDLVVLDTNTELLEQIETLDFPLADIPGDNTSDEVDTMADFEQGGLSFGCDGTLWAVNLAKQIVVGIETNESDVCDWSSSVNLFINEPIGTVAAEGESSIELVVNTTDLPDDQYQGNLVVINDSPYGDIQQPLSIQLRDSIPGRLEFADDNLKIENSRTVRIPVRRSVGNDFAVELNYRTVSGTAIANVHFEPSEGVVRWEDGDDSIKLIEVKTIVTSSREFKEFTVELSSPTAGAELGPSSVARVTITTQSGSFEFIITSLLAVVWWQRRRHRLPVIKGFITE